MPSRVAIAIGLIDVTMR